MENMDFRDLGIKVVCLDIYGTVLASNDEDNCFPPRAGLEVFLQRCKEKNVAVVSTSDTESKWVRANLENCFKRYPDLGLNIEMFSDFICLDELPVKDFSRVARTKDVQGSEILVIGDTRKDSLGAVQNGCHYILCPAYTIDNGRDFDFSKILI